MSLHGSLKLWPCIGGGVCVVHRGANKLGVFVVAACAHLYHIDPITVRVASMSVKRPVL